MRDIAAEAEELCEDDVEDSEHHKWTKECPEVTENGALIAELKVCSSKLQEKDSVVLIQEIGNSHICIISQIGCLVK